MESFSEIFSGSTFGVSATTFLLVTCLIFVVKSKKPKYKTLPYAPSTSLFETATKLASSDAPWFLVKLADKTGRRSFRLPIPLPGGVYVVGDYDLSREILQDPTTEKPSLIYKQVEFATGGKSIFNSPTNDYWKLVRKHLAHSFSKNEVTRMREVCNRHVHEWMDNTLGRYADEGITFDPTDEMTEFNFRAICETAFEYQASEAETQMFCHSLGMAMREFRERMMNPVRRYFAFMIPHSRETMKEVKHLIEFGARLLQAYRENPNKSSNKTMIRLIAECDKFQNDQERISEILTFVTAAHDTTGNTLGSLLYLLAKHPDVAETLRKELSKVPSEQWWEKVDYLEYVMKEGMRVLPVAAMFPVRQTGRDIVYKGEYIPKGAVCFLAQIVSFWNPDTFEDPSAFKPERWENATKAMNDSVTPFTLGKRNCIGQALAKAELQSVLPMLVSKYKFELVEDGKTDYFLTLKISGARLKAYHV
jgi:cytochrome P450